MMMICPLDSIVIVEGCNKGSVVTNTKMVKFILELCSRVFGFAKLQEKTTYGLGHNIKLTESKYDAVLKRAEAIAGGRIKIDIFHWYEPHYTPSIPEQGTITKRISIKTPTELRYTDLSVFLRKINKQSLWNFELGSQESIKNPIWTFEGFQQRDRQDSQKLNFDTFLGCQLLAFNA